MPKPLPFTGRIDADQDAAPLDAALRGFWHGLRARMARPAQGFHWQAEPPFQGSPAGGRALLGGLWRGPEGLIALEGRAPWDAADGHDIAAQSHAHDFHWLDDLSCLPDGAGRGLAQAWVARWVAHHAKLGLGDPANSPIWRPEIAALRLMRWLTHTPFLLAGQNRAAQRSTYQALARHAAFVARIWPMAPHRLGRLRAIGAVIYASHGLLGQESLRAPALRELALICREWITGGMDSRNPQDLAETLALLIWLRALIAPQEAPDGLPEAIARLAGMRAVLTHADGNLARFHGADHIPLPQSPAHLAQDAERSAMGYLRAGGEEISLIFDAGAPDIGAGARMAHASSLGFEMVSGAYALITNFGPATGFGPEWHRACRATAAHSTLMIEGRSSAHLLGGRLSDGPREVGIERIANPAQSGERIVLTHDGYRQSHGLTHIRAIDITRAGGAIAGEDALAPLDASDRARLIARVGEGAVAFRVMFHLHPHVSAQIDMGGRAVSLMLPNGEMWIFRGDGRARLELRPSVYLQRDHLEPRATKQVVLFSSAADYGGAVSWSLVRV